MHTLIESHTFDRLSDDRLTGKREVPLTTRDTGEVTGEMRSRGVSELLFGGARKVQGNRVKVISIHGEPGVKASA